VAKSKSLTLVFDAAVVVYAAADITPDVLKILQK
jgi:Skp family chaperone for outer membrane proteins